MLIDAACAKDDQNCVPHGNNFDEMAAFHASGTCLRLSIVTFGGTLEAIVAA